MPTRIPAEVVHYTLMMEWMPAAHIVDWVPRLTDSAKEFLATAFTELEYPFCYDAQRIIADGHDAHIGTPEHLEPQYEMEEAKRSLVIHCETGGADVETRILNALVACFNHKVKWDTYRASILPRRQG
jgi:hypothetical protein